MIFASNKNSVSPPNKYSIKIMLFYDPVIATELSKLLGAKSLDQPNSPIATESIAPRTELVEDSSAVPTTISHCLLLRNRSPH
jgi:hypothetical protein